jgi:hypothetical protein
MLGMRLVGMCAGTQECSRQRRQHLARCISFGYAQNMCEGARVCWCCCRQLAEPEKHATLCMQPSTRTTHTVIAAPYGSTKGCPTEHTTRLAHCGQSALAIKAANTVLTLVCLLPQRA